MASNITAGASSTFTTTNMKPAVNEQIDALKAQNDADNMGHLYFRHDPMPIVSWGSGINSGILISAPFYKRASHNAIRFCFASNAGLGSMTAYLEVFSSVADYATDPASASANLTQTFNADTAYSLEVDISGLSNGGLYYAKTRFSGSVSTLLPPTLVLAHSLGAVY